MARRFICPMPYRWSEIFQDLHEAFKNLTGKKLPSQNEERMKAGGPPIPLILGGWDATNNEKAKRWEDTLLWAKKNNFLYLTEVKEEDKYYGYLCE